MLRASLIVIWIMSAVVASAAGWEYYLTPLQERPFSEGHNLFASSSVVGHGYGVLGSGFMIVGVLSYSARRRVNRLAKVGKLKHWLQVHIFLCTLGPFLIVLHSAFRVSGLVAIAFWSMVLVVASGVFGRYLYVRIPKTIKGTFLSLEELGARRAEVLTSLRDHTSVDGSLLANVSGGNHPAEALGLRKALQFGILWELNRKRREKAVRTLLEGTGAPSAVQAEMLALALEEARLGSQVALLQPFRRLFRYWHVFHLPLAIVMFLILGVHITVAVLFGYAWIL